MKSVFYVVSALLVMGLAVWAYRQNYETQARLKDVRELREEIADLRERAGVLRAEWAYLNRPERLADLADMNFDRLHLLPLRPEHFGRIDQVPYPVRNAVEVMSNGVTE